MNFKATFHYKNGKLTDKDLPSIEGLPIQESIPVASITGGIELAISPVANSYQANGKIIIEVVNDQLFLDYHIEPLEAIPHLRDAVAQFYTVSQK